MTGKEKICIPCREFADNRVLANWEFAMLAIPDNVFSQRQGFPVMRDTPDV